MRAAAADPQLKPLSRESAKPADYPRHTNPALRPHTPSREVSSGRVTPTSLKLVKKKLLLVKKTVTVKLKFEDVVVVKSNFDFFFEEN